MADCAKCGYKLDAGITVCPGCKASLSRPGAFTEVLGWVLAVVAFIPLIIGEKTFEQKVFAPLITGGAMFVIGVILVVVGKGRARGAENPVREAGADAAAEGGRGA